MTGLRRALPDQLGGVSVRKLAGSTLRFYQLGWDALSLATAVHEAYDQLGKPFPRYRPGNPAAWLGWILRQVDQHATPALRRYDHLAEAGPDTEPCLHDVPGGARLSLVTGQPRCPLCRRAWSSQR